MATVTHTSYKCDKCGKQFDKHIEVKHSFPGPGYGRGRDDYVHVNFTLDIRYGEHNKYPDLCPGCIREALKGALKDLDEQVGVNIGKHRKPLWLNRIKQRFKARK